jgi:excinuclease ABC subunit A
LVVEHNTDVIRRADWIIELGPEAGEGGGNLVYEGSPSGISGSKESLIKAYL